MDKPKINLVELEKIVQEMTHNSKHAPNYNQAAADIVAAGVVDKTNARNGYVPKLFQPSPKQTL